MFTKTVKNTLGFIIVCFIVIGGLSLFKTGGDTMLAKILLGAASFSPLNPQISAESNNLCIEKSRGISIQIQVNSVFPVFKRDGSRQCEEDSDTLSIKEMEKDLKKKGIKIFKSVKGHLSTGRGLSVCGSPTNSINIFYVSSKKKKEVLNQGFQSCIEK